MRNLKRVLSLGMTAAMITGLMVVGTSAAGYSDVSTEDNVEAIEVLQSVGVMVGDENGDFNPDQLVTRNEMAVVMSNLMEYRVATYAGTSPFTDVPSWAEPYVAACWTNGITAGTSATTYGGDQSVTTAQAALMLMKALGYFQYDSDFNGDWQLATITQGNKISLFHDVDSGVREAMTRNDVAQLVLNTLESGMVEANKSGQDITVGDITITNSVEYEYVTSQEPYARAIDTLRGASATSISTQGYIVELGEKLYDGDLRRTENTTDAYGRPGTQWVYNLDEVGTYADAPLATYTDKVTKGDLYSLVSKSRLDDIDRKGQEVKDSDNNFDHYEYTFTVYADGKFAEVDGTVLDHIGKGEFGEEIRNTYFVSNSSAAAGAEKTNGVSGKGVQTEVYLDDDGNITLVYINTYLMQATADYNEAKDTLSVDLITTPSDFEGLIGNINVNQLNGDDFDITGYSEDDYILYTIDGNTIEDIYPATVVTGEVDAYSKTKSVTLDGTQYDYAALIDTEESKDTEYRVGDTAAVVVDKNGYVLYVDSAAISLGNYLFLNGYIAESGLASSYIANGYFTDGTASTITIDEIVDESLNSSRDATHHELDGWYSYSVNSDDEYRLVACEAGNHGNNNAVTATKLEGNKVSFLTDASKVLRGNSDTVLIVNDGDEGKSADLTVYTGISNFPEITIDKDSSTKSFNVFYMLKDDDKNSSYVSLVYVDAVGDAIDVAGSIDSLLFVLDEDRQYVDSADNETIHVYNAILDGEETTIESKSAIGQYKLYNDYSIDGDGYYEVSPSDVVVSDNDYTVDDLVYARGDDANVTVSGGSMVLNGEETFVISDDTQINVVLVPDEDAGSAMADIMTDRAADWEIYLGLTGKRLNSMLSNYGVSGEYYVQTEDDDSDVATVVYIVVRDAVEIAD